MPVGSLSTIAVGFSLIAAFEMSQQGKCIRIHTYVCLLVLYVCVSRDTLRVIIATHLKQLTPHWALLCVCCPCWKTLLWVVWSRVVCVVLLLFFCLTLSVIYVYVTYVDQTVNGKCVDLS